MCLATDISLAAGLAGWHSLLPWSDGSHTEGPRGSESPGAGRNSPCGARPDAPTSARAVRSHSAHEPRL
eukprot:2135378-Lingulodinium_polyedra.AAC.1